MTTNYKRLKAIFIAVLPFILAACMSATPLNNTAENSETKSLGGSLVTESSLGDGEVIITIDESPFTPQTDLISDYLRSEGITAVFFLVGDKLSAARNLSDDPNRVEYYPEKLRKIIEDGHYIANHSYTHPCNYGQLSEATQASEIIRTHVLISRATRFLGELDILGEQKPAASTFKTWFRPPCGSWDNSKAARIRQLLIQNGGQVMKSYSGPVMWNLGRGNENFRCLQNGLDSESMCPILSPRL